VQFWEGAEQLGGMPAGTITMALGGTLACVTAAQLKLTADSTDLGYNSTIDRRQSPDFIVQHLQWQECALSLRFSRA
jgi:hypothetical protein